MAAKIITVVTGVVVLVISTAVYARSSDSISAHYIQPRGNFITWKIRIPAPAPAAVIVTQYILPVLIFSNPLTP